MGRHSKLRRTKRRQLAYAKWTPRISEIADRAQWAQTLVTPRPLKVELEVIEDRLRELVRDILGPNREWPVRVLTVECKCGRYTAKHEDAAAVVDEWNAWPGSRRE